MSTRWISTFFFYDIQPLNPSAEASRQHCIQQILYLYLVPWPGELCHGTFTTSGTPATWNKVLQIWWNRFVGARMQR